eukprot:7702124-Lingulodinium_polyedra.AAC.1
MQPQPSGVRTDAWRARRELSVQRSNQVQHASQQVQGAAARIRELEEIIRDKEVHFLRSSKSLEMLGMEKKRMEFQRNEQAEELKITL